MKRARRQNRIMIGSIATAVLLGVFYGAVRYTHAVIARAPITVSYNPTLSDTYQTQLNADIVSALHAKGPAAVVAEPTIYSPILSALTVHYRYPYHGILTYQLNEPTAYLNDMAVVLQTGELVSHDMINAEERASLPSVQVPNDVINEPTVSKVLHSFIEKINPVFADRFVYEWRDGDSCCYRDRQNARYTLVASGVSPITEHDIKLFDAALGHHRSERTAKRWMVDIRFKDQVVIAPDGGL